MRKIEPKLVAYIDERLKLNNYAQLCIKNLNARAVFVCAAEALLGVREATNNNDGELVELIQETVGGHANESWCMSYVQSCIAYAELKTGVKSPLIADELCYNVWAMSSKEQRVQRFPARGAIAIWNYPPGHKGHTGIVDQYEHKKGKMLTFEGNTTAGLKADGTIESDGGGSYHAERSTSGSKKMVLLGFLKPF